jgi:hypothetical protein
MSDWLEAHFASARYLWVAAIGCLIIIQFIPLIHQPYLEDDVSLVKAIQGIANSGQAYYYGGELAPREFGGWNVPSYLYLQAMFHSITGGWFLSFRLFGAILIFPFLMATFALAKECFANHPHTYTLSILSLCTLLLIPATVTNFAILDFDAAYLAMGMTAFLWMAVQWEKTSPSSGHLARKLLLPFVAVLWFKMTTPLLLPVVLSIYVGQRRGWRDAFRFGLWFSGLGFGIFMLTWLAFTYGFLGRPPGEMFHHVFIKSLARFTAGENAALAPALSLKSYFLVQKLLNQRYALPFLSTFLVIIAALDLAWRIRQLRNGMKREALDLLRLTLWMGLFFQSFIRLGVYGYPKYLGPYIPLLAIISAVRIFEAFREISGDEVWRKRNIWLLTSWLGGTMILLALAGADPMLPGRYGPGIRLLIPLGTGWGIMYLIWRSPRDSVNRIHAVCGLLHVAVFLVALPVWWQADYARQFCYGQRGFEQTLARLQEVRTDGQMLAAPRGISLYDGKKYIRTEDLFNRWDDPAVQAFLRSPSLIAIVGSRCSSAYVYADQGFLSKLKGHFPVEERYGDYVIRLRNRPPGS